LRRNDSSGFAMEKISHLELSPIDLTAARARYETERACLSLVQTELEVAFSYLLQAEADNRDGSSEIAAQMIPKAIATHNMALTYLANVPAEFETEKRELYVKTRQLFNAIRAAASPETR
jgi:hypothetical protein